MNTEQNTHTHRIRVFSALQVEVSQGQLNLTGEKVKNLLAYLVLHPHIPHRRETLAELLFSESSPDRARRNLSDTLHRLQKALGTGWLAITGDTISLAVDGSLWVDAWEFDQLAVSQDLARLEQAIALYTGDLLPEIYTNWILPERELRRNQLIAALEKLAAQLEAQGELQLALSTTRRLILAEPLHEPAHQTYLRLLGRLRRYGEAFAHYDDLRQRLQSELKIDPHVETHAIIQAFEHERDIATTAFITEEQTFSWVDPQSAPWR